MNSLKYLIEHKCNNCDQIVIMNQCEYIRHEFQCPECGYCPDCADHERKFGSYNAMINDPEYFFEPYYAGDQPGDYAPRKPAKRLTSFPTENMTVTYMQPELIDKNEELKANFFSIPVKYMLPAYTNIEDGLSLRSHVEESIEYTVTYYDGQEAEVDPWGAKLWSEFEERYTLEALEQHKQQITRAIDGFLKID